MSEPGSLHGEDEVVSGPFPDADAVDDSDTAPATEGDRRLVIGFAIYVAVLLVGAFGQLTNNRTILDLLDARRLFSE
ncbi:MAG: hypothetical protein ACYTDX_06190 [Planctomycetota bacterium]|jgi:hypothetical protein